MTLSRGALRAIIATFFCLLAAVYVIAWLAPAAGLHPDAARNLVTAGAIRSGHGYTIASLPAPVPETQQPPLFPALLALFTLISKQTQWLKLLPLAATVCWLVLTRRLLLKMGASRNGAVLLIALTAASPTVIFLSTSLLAETLFALLATAALLALLEERVLAAGLLAGLATLTETAGVALIAACILTLVARRRLRGAVIFAGIAMIMVAPWFGWSLANVTQGRLSNWQGSALAQSNILTGLAASEKLVVLARNFLAVIASPVSLLTGLGNWMSTVGTVLVLLWCFFKRRQFVPDLFVFLYCIVLICRTAPPERFVAPVLPMMLWIVWRVLRFIKSQEALAAMVVIACAFPLWANFSRIAPTLRSGTFDISGAPVDDWDDMQALFTFIRKNTPPRAVLLANLDETFYLNTGRKAIRGFEPNGFEMYYSPRHLPVTPDELSKEILENPVSYVVLTPDRGLPESATFHSSVEALERGGIVQPVYVPGAPRDYQLFSVTR